MLPLRNGAIPSKPPLFHWIAASVASVTGLSDAAVRAPSAIADTLWKDWGPLTSGLLITLRITVISLAYVILLEGAVVTEAMDVIESGKSRLLEFGVADETAWKVGLSCGGTIRVLVEKVD